MGPVLASIGASALKNWKGVLVGAVGISLLFALWWVSRARDHALKERNAAYAELGTAKAELLVLRVDAAAREKAAGERVKDAAAVAAQKKELVDAIKTIPDTAPDSIRLALACQRLRAYYGEKHSAVPAQCRPD